MFLSYAREDTELADRLTRVLVARGKDVWIDVEDIRGGASDWRASVWAGIESATTMVFVLTPDSLASKVCGEELQRAGELNKRIIPVLRRPVDGLTVPPALERPNWVHALRDDDFEATVTALVDALELDEAWVEQHARLSQRTGEWLRHERDGSYLLRGSDLREAEQWLDDEGAHRESPTAQQVTYITASRRAAARRQRGLLAGVGLALVLTSVLAVVALVMRSRAIDRELTARSQARAAQSIAELSRDPEASVRDALEAVDIRRDEPEAVYALRRAVSLAGWTAILRLPDEQPAGLTDVEFSEDGKRVATGGEDGKIAVWAAPTGQPVTDFEAGGEIHTVQFSPDGRRLLTATDDGVARIWDSSTGQRLLELDTDSDKVWSATWGDRGRRILTASPRGGALWDAASGDRLRLLAIPAGAGYRGTIHMSLAGRRAVTPVAGGARLWNLATGQAMTLKRKPKPRRGPDVVDFSQLSADGRRIATYYDAGGLCIWDAGRRAPRFCASPREAFDIDLSRDGRRVLRAAKDGPIEVWDIGSRRPHRLAVLHNGAAINSAKFDRSGEYVVAAGDDGVARVWQLSPVRRVAVLRGHTDGVAGARFSPDGSQIATVSDDGSGRLWPSRPLAPPDARWQGADGAVFGPDSRKVLVVRGERRAVWDTGSGAIVPLKGGAFVSDPDTRPCGRAAGCSPWSPDGRSVAGVTAALGAAVWDAATGKPQPFGQATGTVSSAAFSPDGRSLVVTDVDRPRAQLWNVARVTPSGTVPRRGRLELYSAQFLPNPLRLLIVDGGGRARLVDPATGTSASLPGDVLPVAVTADPDGRLVALGTTDADAKLHVYTAADGSVRTQDVPGSAVTSIAFNRYGTAIVTGGRKGTALIWDVGTLDPTPLRAPGGAVSGAMFGGPEDNLVLVTAGPTARLWDRTLPRVIVELPRTPGVRAELSPDGRRIVLAGASRLQVVACDACLPLDELKLRARSLLPATS